MYPYTIAEVVQSLIDLFFIMLGIVLVEIVVIKIYDKWKGEKNEH